MLERKEEHVDVLVSGMGPAGLGTAIAALIAGKTVGIIFNRAQNDFNRQQKVFLEEESRNYLIQLFYTASLTQPPTEENARFIAFIDHNQWTPIAEIEKFLFRHVLFLAEQNKKNLHPNFPLQIFYNSHLNDVDLNHGIAVIQSTENTGEIRIHFDILFGADGANHHATDVVNRRLPKKTQITYSRDFLSTFNKPHQYHIGIKNIRYEALGDIPEKDKEETCIGVLPIGSDDYYYSIIALKIAGTKHAICDINCEIPANLYHDYYKTKAAVLDADNEGESKEHIEKYQKQFDEVNRRIIEFIKQRILLMTQKPDSILIPADTEGHPIFSLFLCILQQASTAMLINKSNQKAFFLVGDAYRTAYYPIGTNLNIAFKQIQHIPPLFLCSSEELENTGKKYALTCKEFASETKKKIRIGLLMGKRKSWAQGASLINQMYSFYLCDRAIPSIHHAAQTGDFAMLEKKSLTELAIQNIKGMNILHCVMDAGAINIITQILEWLTKEPGRQKIFIALLFQNAPSFDGKTNTPITILMENKRVSEDEKKKIFYIIVKSVFEILNPADAAHEKEKNTLYQLAEKYIMGDLTEHFNRVRDQEEKTVNDVPRSKLG